MFTIIPSPGTADKEWHAIEKKLESIKPVAHTVHIDIIDGKFAQNTTFLDPNPFKKFADTFLLEVHLMVEEPQQYIKPFAQAGFKRFIGQIEHMSDQAAFVAEAEEVGEAGLAVDGSTPLENITVSHLDLDVILVMTIQAGFSGQQFLPEKLEKVRKLSEQASFLPVEVDGGVNEQTIQEAWKAGARRFVATSAIFNTPDPVASYTKLHGLVSSLADEGGSW